MVILFVILILVACIFLGLIILVQNPKGGGLASNVGGFSNQIMGVKQTTDVLEKGTWVLAIFVALLCICSAVFVPRSGGSFKGPDFKVNAGSNTAPSNQSAPPANQPVQK
jgi:preprotein translocase subunit SecG